MLNKNYIRYSVSFLFITIAIIAIFNAVNDKNIDNIFWFCYVSLFLIGLGISTKNSLLLQSQINILLIPQMIWSIDFFYRLFTGQTFWGITDYFFLQGGLSQKIVSIQHIYTVPLTLYMLSLIKINKKDAWKYSFIQITVIFFLSLFFTNPNKNVNCVFKSCLPFIQTNSYYHYFVWFAIVFVGIFITNAFLTRLPFIQKLQTKIKNNSGHK